MWAANAATISPSADTRDNRLHLTPANLIAQLHRSTEANSTAATLRKIFPDESRFAHHAPLPCQATFADEGAANHTRLCAAHGQPGIELFVYGKSPFSGAAEGPLIPKKFQPRQSLEASRAIARLHHLDPARTLFLQQHPDAIDAGVFHNDVAAVGNENVLLCHARTYVDQPTALAKVREAFAAVSPDTPLHVIEVADEELTLEESVDTYLFNSQIVTLPDNSMALIAPGECEHHPRARAVIDRLLSAGTPIRAAHFVPVRQSMRNGGGPACLRLRVTLTDDGRAAAHNGVFLTDALHAQLQNWVTQHYRDELHPQDLADPALYRESQQAQTDLYRILHL